MVIWVVIWSSFTARGRSPYPSDTRSRDSAPAPCQSCDSIPP